MKTMHIIGGADFIGSNFMHLILNKHADYKIINLDVLTYAGNLDNLKDVKNNPNYFFIKSDIGDRMTVERVFTDNKIDYVVNFAAESHVDRSITDPEIFVNALGWSPRYTFERGMKETIHWYLDNSELTQNIVNGVYQHYYKKMYE